MHNGAEQIFLLNSGLNPAALAAQRGDAIAGTNQVNLEDVQDFSTVCRTCATITDLVIPIFEGEGKDNNLADKIQKHLPIQVLENDRLPRVVCYQCASTLLAWHELVKCSLQADEALKARLAQLQGTPSSVVETKWSASKKDQDKSPPRYADACSSMSPAAEPPKTCRYCRDVMPAAAYNDHLVDDHAELLFYCKECDAYVDRKELILHMTFHCVQLAKVAPPEPTIKTEPIRTRLRNKQIKEESANTKPKREIPIGFTKKEPGIHIETKADKAESTTETNEFSDHSDAEYGFGPLPESVFDAIEDSQDKSRDTSSTDNQTDSQSQSTTDKEEEPKGKVASHKKQRTCPICAKTYNASSSYFYHMKYFHRQSKEHECEVCGRKFGTRGSLASHASIHTGECRLECSRCGKRFRSKASLYIHSQTHSPSAGSACGVCGRVFRWRAALRRHTSRHSAARAHTCATCGRAFSVRCDLIRHARTHERGEFACEHCKATFAQPRYLRVHLLKKHGVDSKEKSGKDVNRRGLRSVQNAG